MKIQYILFYPEPTDEHYCQHVEPEGELYSRVNMNYYSSLVSD